jgi:four helix bundle protein
MSHFYPTARFAHQRLDAYRVAVELFREVEDLTSRFPRGHADLKDQMRRSAAATVRHIAEGANRFEPRDKSNRFLLARAECGECDSTLEMAMLVGVLGATRAERMRALADRVAAMTWRLSMRERNRAGP